MQALIYPNKDIKEFMEKENIVFEEKDRVYLVIQNNSRITKNLAKIKFWAINSVLKDFHQIFHLLLKVKSGKIKKRL